MHRHVLSLCAFLILYGHAAAANPARTTPAAAVRVGVNQTTLDYVRSTIEYHTGHAAKATYTTLTDADLYRQFLAGQLDMVSVFGRPDELGIGGFAKAFHRPPTELVVGHVACMVVVPADRRIDRLTLTQLADVVAGKITTWDQLGGGTGRIEVLADPAALAVLLLRTGVPSTKNVRFTDRGDTGWNVYTAVSNRVGGRKQPAGRDEAKPDILGLAPVRGILDDRHDWKNVKLVPVATAERDEAVKPTLTRIREETYPLSTTWRILVHSEAPPRAAGFAKLCLRGYESLGNAQYVLAWLVQPRQDELGNVVRVLGAWHVQMSWWELAMDPALDAYGKTHPSVTIGRPRPVRRYVDDFIEENADLLYSGGHFLPEGRKQLLQLYQGNIPEQVIGYQPLLVLVHPACPLKQMTLEQLRMIARPTVTLWSQVGWTGEETPMVKRARDFRILQEALLDGQMRPLAAANADQRALARFEHLTDASVLREAKDDVHGITFALSNDAATASGLKVLAIADSKGTAVLPKPADVISGRYPARYPMTLLLHPKAGEPARRLLEWLRGPEAGVILAARHIYTPAYAGRREPEKTPVPPVQNAAIPANVSGGVAVLPTECLSLYFLMAGEAHRAAYDRAITEAIAADGRLRMVDREQIERVLEERKNALLSGQIAAGKPIVAADVFVMPGIVTEDTKTWLRVQAYHGATASLLAEVKILIDPAMPTLFDPPLDKVLAAWWPEVLRQLVAVRSLPVWSVVAVYPGESDDWDAVDLMGEQLSERLAAGRGLFLARYLRLDAAQQEVLLAAMGIGRPIGGRFTPAADVLVEGRQIGDALEIRLRAGKTMAVMAQKRFRGTPAARVDEAAVWCLAQAAARKWEGGDADLEDWAAEQSKLSLRHHEQLKAQYWALKGKAQLRAAEKGQRELLPTDASAIASLAEAGRQSAARAAQVDPANESAVYAVASNWDSDNISFYGYLQRAIACERYCDRFPSSPRWREVMERAIAAWNECYRYTADEALRGSQGTKVPAGMDHTKAARIYLGKTVHCLRQYVRRYLDCYDNPKEKRGSSWGFLSLVNFYQRRLAVFLAETNAAPEEVEREIGEWAKLLDPHPQLCSPSDMLRLEVLTAKKDRAGFLAALAALQKTRPNPKDAWWGQHRGRIKEQEWILFPEASARDNLDAWLDGRTKPAVPKQGG